MLGGAPLVDVHHHVLPEGLLAELSRRAGGASRLVDERISITLTPDLADAGAHLRAMDHAGVDVAVLTYSGVAVLGREVCRALNDGLAELARRHPGRFVAAAHVDLEDDAAVAELEGAVRDYGSRLVALPCSSPGRQLDDARLLPLWERIAELGLAVILHPSLLPSGASLDYGMERSCARPHDTTVAAIRLLGGVLWRVPGLRVVLPHCGGTATFLKGRLQMFFTDPAAGERRSIPRTQRELADAGLDEVFERLWRSFYFDTAGTGGWAPALEFTAGVVGCDRLMFGSDFPLESHTPETLAELVAVLGSLALEPEERRAVAGGTALALLGDSAPSRLTTA